MAISKRTFAHLLPLALLGIEPARAPRVVLSPEPLLDPPRRDTKVDHKPFAVVDGKPKRLHTPPSSARKRNRKRRGWR